LERRSVLMIDILKDTHHILDFIQEGFIITDIHSKIIYTNHYTERLFGYSKEELKGQRIRILFLEEDLTYFLPNIVYLSLYKNGFEGEALLKQKDGRKIFIHLSTASFKEGGDTYLVFSLQEIQRLKRLERERLEMNHWASLGLMVEEVAHQIRNPIASIGGYAQRLLNIHPISQKGKSYIHRILNDTKRLEKTIQRVEEYVLTPRPVYQKESLSDIVTSTLQTLSEVTHEKGISFNLEMGSLEGEGDFYTDKGLISKVLLHLFQNSIDAIPHHSGGEKRRTIQINLFGNGDAVGISISDKGEGIAKKNIHHIFEPFFSTRPDHIGLGLTFSKKVIEELGGEISVESRLRKGTTVTLTFPRDRRRKIRREFFSPSEQRPFE